jgi:hypothetical protein
MRVIFRPLRSPAVGVKDTGSMPSWRDTELKDTVVVTVRSLESGL